MDNSICEHFSQKNPNVKAETKGCEECLKIGQQWVHLRICLVCGHVGCCDNSVGKHATAHFKETGHPIIQSFEPEETWEWCYVDELNIDPEKKEYSE